MPVQSCQSVGLDVKEDTLAHFFVEVAGAHAAGLAVSSYLAAVTSAEKALGYGHLARTAVVLKLILTDRPGRLGLPTALPYGPFIIFSALAYNYFKEVWKPLVCAEISAVVMVLGGLSLLLTPSSVLEDYYAMNENEIIAWGMCQFVGMYVLMSGLHTALIAGGVDGVTAVGYTSLVVIPFLPVIFGHMDVSSLWGIPKKVLTTVSYVTLAGIGIGILKK